MKVLIFALVALIHSGLALQCMKCGEDGVCKPGVESKSAQCLSDEKSCGLAMVIFNGTIVEWKDCFMPKFPAVTGCVDIDLEVDQAKGDEKLCLCASNDCNQKLCDTDRCDCPFANPNQCVSPDPNAEPRSCISCAGDACKDGNNATSIPCRQGESSCQFVHLTVEINGTKQELYERGCDLDLAGGKRNGCYQTERENGSKGDVCYCSTNDCNKVTCDPYHCDCVYADPQNCHDHDDEPETTTVQGDSTTTTSSAMSFKASLMTLIFAAFY